MPEVRALITTHMYTAALPYREITDAGFIQTHRADSAVVYTNLYTDMTQQTTPTYNLYS
jgi:hypothetical protein